MGRCSGQHPGRDGRYETVEVGVKKSPDRWREAKETERAGHAHTNPAVLPRSRGYTWVRRRWEGNCLSEEVSHLVRCVYGQHWGGGCPRAHGL